ncbi:V-type H+-transporting ATPase 16kDa proteolipid subunit [Nematocida parisii]|uniref:V-ATPase proteolipid subunit C-like domain-containing protein n=1 Tax=Nematocida parisii (strain ERTm3) TaxID=935791 RepID=I3EEF9_NEMP3|nr:uncharacterized protein NEPG_02233 [Nematocida parisii ERTm1]EIJ87606.1 hypothetical protein NEQG_02153 [Nematocida parisii ERTm3]KAI5126698.1 V-type H+-transporting ATPase 16kDa proteolipid subunit [Nematocida parisii]KAI5166669.1 V-type H+-transporting ATPase 16kDa proteolipid subunit [Nematocida sp. AWRm79]KAI5183507.1 V-type H+-transporting ATPase 16kDa proteolipid subunit [Nematocida sp. AWRm78]OAG33574.1 V-type H+-transporting ATPase 16kDa proteolipid subunit [Nematocida sp. ERTm5]|eukprot:XP_013060060.1 hypothetical protein NEPG_02233 [Nematocida parisii ERTm1]
MQKLLLECIYPIGVISLLCPTFAGVSLGMSKASIGICNSASIKSDIILTIIPSAFIGVGVLYSVLLFFTTAPQGTPTEFSIPMKWLAAYIVTGMGMFWGSISLGDISAVATVTAAQQKRFKPSFFLLLVFGELIGLFGLIVGFILSVSNRVWA